MLLTWANTPTARSGRFAMTGLTFDQSVLPGTANSASNSPTAGEAIIHWSALVLASPQVDGYAMVNGAAVLPDRCSRGRRCPRPW